MVMQRREGPAQSLVCLSTLHSICSENTRCPHWLCAAVSHVHQKDGRAVVDPARTLGSMECSRLKPSPGDFRAILRGPQAPDASLEPWAVLKGRCDFRVRATHEQAAWDSSSVELVVGVLSLPHTDTPCAASQYSPGTGTAGPTE